VYDFRGISMARFDMNFESGAIRRLQPQALQLDESNNAYLKDLPREFGPPPHQPEKDPIDMSILETIHGIIKARGPQQESYLLSYEQIRITTDAEMSGFPTREGVHQDGAEYVFIMYVDGKNLTSNSGESRVYDLDQPHGQIVDESAAASHRLFQHSMRMPFEFLMLDDRRVKHDNLPVVQLDASLPATRDVLVCWARPYKESDDRTLYTEDVVLHASWPRKMSPADACVTASANSHKFSSNMFNAVEAMRQRGFAHVPGFMEDMSLVKYDDVWQCNLSVAATDVDLDRYKKHWDHLPQDPVYKFRGASMARFEMNLESGRVSRLQPQSFQLDESNNAYLKSLPREFGPPPHQPEQDPVDISILQIIIGIIQARAVRQESYLLGYHQFRITTDAEMFGLPTKEGVHQDGAEFVFIMYVDGENLTLNSGESRVYDLDQPNGQIVDESAAASHRLFQHSMRKPFEFLMLDDRRVKHDNLPVEQLDASLPATRDVLVCWARPYKESDDRTLYTA
jgi:hypothetical protein